MILAIHTFEHKKLSYKYKYQVYIDIDNWFTIDYLVFMMLTMIYFSARFLGSGHKDTKIACKHYQTTFHDSL